MKTEPMALATGVDVAAVCPIAPKVNDYCSGQTSSPSVQSAGVPNWPSPRMGSLRIVRLVFVASVVAWSAVTIREPLWIDELHTLWSIQGDWQEVFARSTAGNQSPMYFYFLKAFTDGVPSPLRILGIDSSHYSGLILRSFSLIGWGSLAWVMSSQILTLHRSNTNVEKTIDRKLVPLFFVGGLWLMSDRTGGFYATEARPYVWVAVACSLLIMNTIPTVSNSWRWLLYCVMAFYLHYTAVFVIATSFLLRSFARGIHSIRPRFIVYEGLALALLMAPGLMHLRSLARSSSQWAYFAGGSDFFTLLRVSPWFAWVVLPALFVLLAKKAYWSDRKGAVEETSQLTVVVLIALLCMATNWLLCYFDWVPLMHSRYLIGIYPAIWIAGMLLLGRFNEARSIVAVGLLAIGLQGYLQGSWPLWGRGEWIAWQRSEDWEKAFEVLRDHKLSGEAIFLAPFLIETEHQEQIDASTQWRQRYFRFPVEALSQASNLDVPKSGLTNTEPMALATGVDVATACPIAPEASAYGSGKTAFSSSHPETVFVLANSTASWATTIEATFDGVKDKQHSAWLLARTSQPWISTQESQCSFDRELLYEAGSLQLWRLRFRE